MDLPCVARGKRELESAVLHQCIGSRVGFDASDHHRNPRAPELISGHALGHEFSDALEGPFLHRLFSLADLGGQKDRGAYSSDSASIRSTAAIAIGPCSVTPDCSAGSASSPRRLSYRTQNGTDQRRATPLMERAS